MSDSTDTPTASDNFLRIEAKARQYGPRPFRVYLIRTSWPSWALAVWSVACVAVATHLDPTLGWLWIAVAVVVAVNIIGVRAARAAWQALRELHEWTVWMGALGLKPAPPPGDDTSSRAED